MSNLRRVLVFALASGVAFGSSAAQRAAKADDSPAAEPRIGVAASKRGQVCVAMPGSPLVAGTIVTLIDPNQPQSVRVVSVDSVAECPALTEQLIAGPHYSVRPFGSDPTVWIAIAGKPDTREIRPGVVAVRLSAAQPDAQVRSCTSTEGLHLTVWAGAPRCGAGGCGISPYYLGYDVEPSCEARDVGDSAR